MIDDWGDATIDIAYFASAMLLIFSLNRLSQPSTARLGNQLAMLAVGIATVATFFLDEIDGNYILIFAGIAIGAVIGYFPAQRVAMTSMPQMVAIFNGLGGAAAALIAVTEFLHDDVDRGVTTSIVLSAIIGAISASGSAIAFAKLQGLLPSRTILPGNRRFVSIGLIGGMALLGLLVVLFESGDAARTVLVLTFAFALVSGVILVLPIGGADMPVVIAMLNSATGISAALTGITLGNQVLVVAGALVGASGGWLTLLMARAMNRSIVNVLFGSFGAVASKGGAGQAADDRPVREVTPDDAAVSLAYAERVVVVPGYGLAVAQAQHAVQELATALQQRGVDVRFAIHPVAGRMPGHMNVLLAEANVPYDDLYEMDSINDDFGKTDVVLVIGANDVTNPAARDDPTSPIYGMPILRVDDAHSIIVLKRSMSSGFAGVENELFYNPKTAMLFGDAKESIGKLITEVKAA